MRKPSAAGLILVICHASSIASAAPSVLVGRAAVTVSVVEPDLCPADPRNECLRAELAGVATREKLPAGLMSRNDYAKLLRLRLALAEQDEAALDALRREFGAASPHYPGLLLMLAKIRGDTALLIEADDRLARLIGVHGRYGPAIDSYRRIQADILLELADAYPDRAAELGSKAAEVYRKLPDRPETRAAAIAAAESAAAIADDANGLTARLAILAAWRSASKTTDDPFRRLALQASVAAQAIDTAAISERQRTTLLVEAAQLARDGEAEVIRLAREIDRDSLSRLAGDLTGSWEIRPWVTNLCLQRAGWRVLAARAALAMARDSASAATARDALAAADRMGDALPDWQRDPSASFDLVGAWFVAARDSAPAERQLALARASDALARAARFTRRCFCAASRAKLATLAADPLLH
jgi:hypothetical protein